MPVRQPLFVLMLFKPAAPDGFMSIQSQLYKSLLTNIYCMIMLRYAWKTFTNGAPMSIKAGACHALPAPTPLALLLPVPVLTASTLGFWCVFFFLCVVAQESEWLRATHLRKSWQQLTEVGRYCNAIMHE